MTIRLAATPPVVVGSGSVLTPTTSGSSGGAGSLGRIPGTYGRDDLLPGGAKIRGVNITPMTGIFWTDFDNVWSSSTQPRLVRELDRAVLLGCNVVQISGSIAAMVSGLSSGSNQYQPISRATYYDRWDWINAQCVTRDLRLYPVAQSFVYDNFTSIPVQFLKDETVAWVQHINAYQNCIGIDLVDEALAGPNAGTGNQPPTTSVLRQAIYDLVKPVTALPLTFSLDGPRGMPTTNSTARNAVRAHVDYFEFHWYPAPTALPAATEIEVGYWQAGETKPVLIGEFGFNANGNRSQATVDKQIAVYGAVKNAVVYVGVSTRRPAGAMNWSCTSYEAAGHDWGVYDFDGTYFAPTGDILKQIPKT